MSDATPVPPVPEAPDTADRDRADLYGLLGTLLAAPPDAGLLARLGGITLAAGEAAPLGRALAALGEAARQTDAGELEHEYFTLFIGLGRGLLVPYGSWYQTGFLMEKPLAVLRDDLAALGFARREGVREPEDHAAALCETMRLIIGRSDLSFEDEKGFFDRHLRPWMGRFFADLQAVEEAAFYRAVAGAGREFLAIEARYFEMPA